MGFELARTGVSAPVLVAFIGLFGALAPRAKDLLGPDQAAPCVCSMRRSKYSSRAARTIAPRVRAGSSATIWSRIALCLSPTRNVSVPAGSPSGSTRARGMAEKLCVRLTQTVDAQSPKRTSNPGPELHVSDRCGRRGPSIPGEMYITNHMHIRGGRRGHPPAKNGPGN